MKDSRIAWAVIVGCALYGSLALAGREGGNGGGAIVCTQGDGSIQSAELLDLKELERAHPGVEAIPRPSEPKSIQLERALARFATIAPDRVVQMRKVLGMLDQPGRREPIPTDETLPPPVDTDLNVLPRERNCTLQGVADYDDKRDVLRVDPVILAAMSETDLAALDFHEAYYKTLRVGPAKAANSRAARLVTAAVFSRLPLPFTSPAEGAAEAKYECDAEGRFHFFVLALPNSRVRFQFTQIEGQYVIDKTFFDLTETSPQSELLRKKALEGFSPYVLPRAKSNQSILWGGAMQTESSFEPTFPIALKGEDLADQCTFVPRNSPQSCHFWSWTQPWLYENEAVDLSMAYRNGGEPGLDVTPECRRLE